MESNNKKYGLIVPKKFATVWKIANLFDDHNDSDSETTNKKPIQTNNQTKAQKRSAQLSIDNALKEDATGFQYDEVYDDMEKKKEHHIEKNKDVKPRYIQNSDDDDDDNNANENRDTDLSDSDSSEDSKRRKIEIHDNKSLRKIVDKLEVKKESITEIKKVDVKDTSPNEEPKEETKEVSKDEQVVKTESTPKKIFG